MMITQNLEFGEDIPIQPQEKEGMCLLTHKCRHLCVLYFRRVFLLLSPHLKLLVDASGSVEESGKYTLKIRRLYRVSL